jgi:hypothetical protein
MNSPISIAASIHHGNAEALTALLSNGPTPFALEQPPSEAWIKQALVSGHVYLLQALDTLNDQFGLGFDSRLKQSGVAFKEVWDREKV